MIRFVIFDLDGTLVDSEPIHLQAFNAILRPMGLAIDPDDYAARYMGLDDRDCFRTVLSSSGRTPSTQELADLIARKHVAFESLLGGRNLLYPGAAEFVARCAARFPLMIVTGALRSEAIASLAAANLAQFFLDIIAADDIEHGKPAPDGFEAALGRLGYLLRDRNPVMPGECLVIEDTAAGVASSRAAGMNVIALCHTMAASHLSAADFVRESFPAIDLDEILRAIASRRRD
jgi:HAD superfamily hydrolase (TIGR01509 family)